MKGMKYKRDSVVLHHSRTRITKNEIPSFEKLLSRVGSEGRFQYFLIFGFMIPLAICYSLASANTFLLLSTPEHFCHVPGRSSTNLTLEEWKNFTIPLEEGSDGQMKFSSCSMFNISDLWSKEIENITWEFVEENFQDKPVIECQHGWEFGNSSWKESLVAQFEWVCEDKYIVTTLFSLSYAGNAIGTFFFAIISNRFGRKTTFYVCLTLNVLFGSLSIFSPSSQYYIIFKFLVSLAFYTLYQMPFIIVVGICSERFRSITAVLSFIACVIGTCLIPLVTFVFPHWKHFVAICHLSPILFYFYFRILPESPRWLLTKGKVKECEAIMKKIAHINGREYNDDVSDILLQAQAEEIKRTPPFRSILHSRVIVKHLILTCFLLSVGYIIYSGLLLNIHNMPGNKELNFFILALVQIPGKIIGNTSAQYFGRRMSAALFTGLTSICCACASFWVTREWILVTVCFLSKMFIGATVRIVYMQIGELFPTSLRASAYGVTGVISIASVILIPPVILLDETDIRFPYYVLCGIGLLGFVLSTFLPETLGNPLPQTLKDAMDIGINQPYFKIIHKWNTHKFMSRKYSARGVIVSRMVF